jgi:hypothetical protein
LKSGNLAQLMAATSFAVLSSWAVAGEWMTGEQIEKLVSGNTTYGKHESKGFTSYSYNRPDGTFVGMNSKDGPRKGTWRVSGNKMCRHPEGRPKEFCQEVKDNGDGTYNRYKQPRNLAMPKKHVFTWTKVVPGNPENLN